MATQQGELSTLQCYNCKEIPWSEIFQCAKGHEICNECYQKITNCPQCKIKLNPKKRIQLSKLAKQVFDSMEFNCPNKKHGCEERLTRMKLPTHREKCNYRSGSFQLCKRIGYKCNFAISQLETSKAIQHFQEVHAFPVNYSNDVTFSLKDVLSADGLQSQYMVWTWTPVIVKLGEEANAPVFLIVGVGKDKIIQLRLWFFGEQAAAKNYRGEFEISGMRSPSLTSKITWTEDSCGIWCEEREKDGYLPPPGCYFPGQKNYYSSNSSYKIPVQLLKQYSSSRNATIIMKATIIDNVNDIKGIVRGDTATCPVIQVDRHLLGSVSHPGASDSPLNFPIDYICEKCKATPIRDLFYASLMTRFYILCGHCASKAFDKENIYAVVTSHRHEKILRGLASADEGWIPVIKDNIVYRLPQFKLRRWINPGWAPLPPSPPPPPRARQPPNKEIPCKGCHSGLGYPENENFLYCPLLYKDNEHHGFGVRPEVKGQFELYPTGKDVHKYRFETRDNFERNLSYRFERNESEDDEHNESDDNKNNGSKENAGSATGCSGVPYVKPKNCNFDPEDDKFVYTYTCLECEDYFICQKCALSGVHWETGHMLAMLSHQKHIFYFKLDGGRNLRRLISFIKNTISDNDA